MTDREKAEILERAVWLRTPKVCLVRCGEAVPGVLRLSVTSPGIHAAGVVVVTVPVAVCNSVAALEVAARNIVQGLFPQGHEVPSDGADE